MAKGDDVLNQFEQVKKEEIKTDGRRLKVGIIGTGWIAESHIQSYQRMPDVDVVALADLIPGKTKFMQSVGDVLKDSGMRKQRTVLKDHSDASFRSRKILRIRFIKIQSSLIRRLKSGNHPQDRCLACSGSPDDHCP